MSSEKIDYFRREAARLSSELQSALNRKDLVDFVITSLISP